MKSPFTRMLYGGDYNPNQWPREVWDEDMRFFRQAHINSATVNVFSWPQLQPAEEVYDFSQLDDIMAMLAREGHDIVLGTATAALPAWMFMRYPEVGRVDYEGRRHRFGRRHNACPNSPVYQKYSALMAAKLAERYHAHEGLACWHVNNEYGGICYCDKCEQAFRLWLQRKYGSLDRLNEAWNMAFWGHTLHSWDEVVVPNALTEGIGQESTAFAGISLDYMRFNSDSILANYVAERDAIRRFDKRTPITTNMMGTYKQLDYFKWAKEIDIVSWDSYPRYNTPWSEVALRHDLMRGLKQAPFMLMEQTPSQQNWQPYNSLKRPGQMRAQSYQTVAHGADTIQFFQLRRSKGACEKFHGAVIAHAGHGDTRVFREVAQLGQELKGLGQRLLGAANPARVGLLFDWDNYWALEYTSGPNQDLKYVDQIHRSYRCLYEKNIAMDVLSLEDDFSKYSLILAPVLYMVKEGLQEKLEAYVSQGGRLVTGFMSGIVDQSDNVHLGGYPGPLKELAGVWVEEIDALAPEQQNTVRYADGSEYSCALLCDLLHLKGAEALAHYSTDFYAGTPVVTRNAFGKGSCYYVGAQLEQAGLSKLLMMACEDAGVKPVIAEPSRLEVTVRETDRERFFFVINLSGEEQQLPKVFAGRKDLLGGETLQQGHALKPFDTLLFAEEK